MLIGIPKEVKDHEKRVGAIPATVRMFVEAGHRVLVQAGAGTAIGFTDAAYQKAGAEIVHTPAELYAAEMVVKVKELQKEEFLLVREGQILFAYLHLAPDPEQTKALLNSKIIGIAYETVTDAQGKLPLLTPMSEVAGRLSIQVGATTLQMTHGGKGILLGGVPGVLPAKVLILGGGASGTEAAKMALGFGANVTIIDRDVARLRTLENLFGPSLKTLYSSSLAIEEEIVTADLVIGAVLIPGKTAPKLITREMIRKMSPGSVFIDLSIDQGGCAETSQPTTHSDPTYIVDGVIHYCVTNMPGACGRTSTQALTNVTSEYVLALANKGWKKALRDNPHLRNGLNVCLGQVTNENVAHDLGYVYCSPERYINE